MIGEKPNVGIVSNLSLINLTPKIGRLTDSPSDTRNQNRFSNKTKGDQIYDG